MGRGISEDEELVDEESGEDEDFVLFKASTPNKRSKSEAVLKEVSKDSSAAAHKKQDNRFNSSRDTSEDVILGNFEKLGLSNWLQKSCNALGIYEPTPIQTACIPQTLKGCNILGQAQTGSGKTAAFALPILETLAKDPYGIYAIVLTPTRELAFQIAEQFLAIGSPIRAKCEIIVGGLDMIAQATALRSRPHVVVATPGRLSWHLRGPDPPHVSAAKYIVLDEADRLLSGTFTEDLKCIMDCVPKSKRQTLLYSATVTEALEKLKSVSKNSERSLYEFYATPKSSTVETLDQRYVLVPDQVKHVYLGYVVRNFGPEFPSSLLNKRTSLKKKKRRKLKDVVQVEESETPNETEVAASADTDTGDALRARSMMIFVSSCKTCELLAETLLELGVECVALSSHLSQNRRLAALAKFRANQAKVLVATDVASRGLDIPQVDLVINYDVPRDPDDYIHRSGRTARAGRKGQVVTFVTQYDIRLVHAIEELTRVKLKEMENVVEDEVLVLMTRVSNAMRTAKMKLEEYGKMTKKRKPA